MYLSPQNLLDCASTSAGTCNGGSWELAYSWIAKNGITEDSCSPYQVRVWLLMFPLLPLLLPPPLLLALLVLPPPLPRCLHGRGTAVLHAV